MRSADSNKESRSDLMAGEDPERSGRDIDEAIAKAEADSRFAEGHRLDDQAPPGESRVERMSEVEEITTGRVERSGDESVEPPPAGPSPGEIGSGGAQRIVGARISDRVAGGEPAPDGPPFADERAERSATPARDPQP
jgi:hypothetical protein